MIVNGTHELVESSTDYRIVNGTVDPAHFKVFMINGTHGTVYGVGNDTANDNTEFFRVIAHNAKAVCL